MPRSILQTQETTRLEFPNWATLDAETKAIRRRASAYTERRRELFLNALTLLGLATLVAAWVLA